MKAKFINLLLADIKSELEDRLELNIKTKMLWDSNTIISAMITEKIREIHDDENNISVADNPK